jgi:hypothetical protein
MLPAQLDACALPSNSGLCRCATSVGGMGHIMRLSGESGISSLTISSIAYRVSSEKCRETGAELHSLTGATNEIHKTLEVT